MDASQRTLMNQSTYTAQESGKSQNQLVLEMLVIAGGEWVSLPDLMRHSGSANIHSRVADLRKRGHNVQWKRTQVGRRIHSWYRMGTDADVA
jgi:hypothetical protein